MTTYVTYENSLQEPALMAFLTAYFGTIMIISLIVTVIMLIAYWKLFVKAGKAGWKCLIPIYNMYNIFDIVYGNGWKFLLLLIPVVNVIYTCILIPYKFAKCFGQSTLFSVLNIFFPYVCYLIMAFGSAQYIGPYTKAPQPIAQ